MLMNDYRKHMHYLNKKVKKNFTKKLSKNIKPQWIMHLTILKALKDRKKKKEIWLILWNQNLQDTMWFLKKDFYLLLLRETQKSTQLLLMLLKMLWMQPAMFWDGL